MTDTRDPFQPMMRLMLLKGPIKRAVPFYWLYLYYAGAGKANELPEEMRNLEVTIKMSLLKNGGFWWGFEEIPEVCRKLLDPFVTEPDTPEPEELHSGL